MTKYHKIQSVWKRDERGQFTTEYSTDEISYLADNQWIGHEKVDGTNIRVIWDEDQGVQKFGGRTDNAQLHMDLVRRLEELFPAEFPAAKLADQFPDGVVLYGEGIGPKVQKNLYGVGWDFVLFDVKVGDWWLKPYQVLEIAVLLGLRIAAIYFVGTLSEAEAVVADGFASVITPEVQAEGLVLRPAVPMFDRCGERVITKIKTKDYKR